MPMVAKELANFEMTADKNRFFFITLDQVKKQNILKVPILCLRINSILRCFTVSMAIALPDLILDTHITRHGVCLPDQQFMG